MSSILALVVVTETGPGLDLRRVDLTKQTTETSWTDTGVAINGINTLCTMTTLIFHTVVIISLTILAGVTWQTLTPVLPVLGDTFGAMLTGVELCNTVIHNLFTKLTCVIGWAKAGIVIDSIDACGVIFTVIIVTVIRIHFAQLSLEAWWAEAPESTFVSLN